MTILVSACMLGLMCRYDGRCNPDDSVIELNKKHRLVPFCPEVYGGLPTPRDPVEIKNGRAVSKSGADVTTEFESGAAAALSTCKLLGCECALLQDRSPSCGYGVIHDGTFGGGLIKGSGFTAHLLAENGIRVVCASDAHTL